MANPLEQAQKSALRTNDDIGKLFDRIGNASHPRGFVTSAYRNATRAMRSALKEQHRELAAADVMFNLRRTLRSEVNSLFFDSSNQGANESARQLRFYGIESNPSVILSQAQTAVDALTAKMDAQNATIQALLMTGAEDAQIIGNDEHSGALRASEIIGTAAIFAAGLFWGAYNSWTVDYSQGREFSKQVVAALDERTTECCLHANGQIQPMDSKFQLTGKPRFSDEMDWTPFHWYCRSSIALYLPEYDMGLTDAMRSGADQIMLERSQGGSGYRHPADAFG